MNVQTSVSNDKNLEVDKSPLHGLWALTNRELKKWYKRPFILLMSLVQPLIWLALFGRAMNINAIFTSGSFNIPGLNIPKEAINQISQQIMKSAFGTSDYFSFLAVGMLSFIALFTAMFSGMSIVWDRRLGFLGKVLSTPISRGIIPLSKVFNAVVRAIVQASIVLIIAVFLGLDISQITLSSIIGTYAALFLMVLGFSSLFVMLALRSTSWETQQAIVNLLNMPLIFASNVMFPAKYMPEWLQPIVNINPISYATDISRQLLLGAPGMASLALDFLYLGTFAIITTAIGIILSWHYLSK
ncbi:MAG: ABC transporter permease [Nitrososphaeria archaeon]|nr:ABC transporter permease [Nitrososphaeria archaeon]